MTFPLLTTASGAKMGKTAQGAVWLEPRSAAPTISISTGSIATTGTSAGSCAFTRSSRSTRSAGWKPSRTAEINEAKRILASRGDQDHSRRARGREGPAAAAAASAAEDGRRANRPERGKDIDALPTTAVPRSRLEAGISPAELFTEVGLTPSRGEAKRLIKQGGLYVNDERIDCVERLLTSQGPRARRGMLLKAGKKKVHRIVPSD